MNPSKFRLYMEMFAEEKNIPLRDILNTIDAIGLESQRIAAGQGEEARSQFLQHQFMIYVGGFGAALPVGTKALLNEDSDDQ